jgi:hypothetical protein
MDWRNGDILEQISQEIIIPNQDLVLKDLDTLDCRIVKFVSKNKKVWKNKDGSVSNETEHVRILIHVYAHKFFSQEKEGYVTDTETAGKKVTINPQLKLMSDLYVLNETLKQADRSLYGTKVKILRKDVEGGANGGKYTTWEFKDLGAAPITDNDNWSLEGPKSYKVEEQSQESSQQNDAPRAPQNIADAVKRFLFISDLKLLSESANALRTAYPEKLTDIVSAFSTRKAAILAEMVKDMAANADDLASLVAAVTKLAEDSYKKEPLKSSQLVQFAKDLYVPKPKNDIDMLTGDVQEDDVPF